MRNPLLLLTFILLAIYPFSSMAQNGVTPGKYQKSDTKKAKLDTNTVRKLYQEGDFDQAIEILKAALKEGKVTNHSDSSFTFKHLGVMYAASVDTRELGKHYMLQLLLIEPTAKIMDMYASDMIYMIFKNIQEELASTQQKFNRAEAHLSGNRAGQTETSASGSSKSKSDRPENEQKVGEKKSRAWMAWTGAAVVIAGIGTTAYLLTDEKPTSVKTVQIE